MGLPSLASEAKEANRMALPSLLSSALQHQHPSIQQHNQQFLNNNFKNSGHPVPRATSPGINLSREESQAKRSRTQINNGQQTALQSIFDLYRSPSLIECELIGSGVGLPKRVVQVKLSFILYLIIYCLERIKMLFSWGKSYENVRLKIRTPAKGLFFQIRLLLRPHSQSSSQKWLVIRPHFLTF